jgi:uncharacterized repeat protein (TIGR03803 family)
MSILKWMTKAFGVFLLWATAAVALPAQAFTTLYSFCPQGGACTDGAFPDGALVQATDGNLYGTTNGGGANGSGTVFKITPSGTLTTLYSFCSQTNCADGYYPSGGLVQGADGELYGTTYYGGATVYGICDEGVGCGTVFKITLGGTLTTIYNFCLHAKNGICSDGDNPLAGLVQATDGNFYGTTSQGGTSSQYCPAPYFDSCGTVFKITPSGTLTTLHSFSYTDGSSPYAGLVEGTDGSFYGTTAFGGATMGPCTDFSYGCGTVFKITPIGVLTTLHRFDVTDGAEPYAGLIRAANGDFYGTTYDGGANSTCYESSGCGTAFKITPSGTLTTLRSFGVTDGTAPYAGMIQATNGDFYGTTEGGGANNNDYCFMGCGTAFEITPHGAATTLYNFCSEKNGNTCQDGDEPGAALIQATNGSFYGTTGGGTNNAGTVFSLSVGLRPFVETQPTSGAVGAAVSILGSNLTGATSVTFNGTAAIFTVVSSSEITTTVPFGATSGKVQVVTPTGTFSSNVPFRVRP